MTTTAIVERDAELYGREVTERWWVKVESEGDAVHVTCEVDVRQRQGSKSVHKEKGVDPADAPDEVLRRAVSELGTAHDAVSGLR